MHLNLALSKGGGVGVYLKNNQEYDIISLFGMNIEGIAIKIKNEDVLFLCVYRPGSANMTAFLHNLQHVLNFLSTKSANSIIMGDFNEDAKQNGPVQTFFKNKNYRQLVNFSTTEGGPFWIMYTYRAPYRLMFRTYQHITATMMHYV